MAQVCVPEPLPFDSQPSSSQRYADCAFEATQVSQPHISQTQGAQGVAALINSQVEPRRKYCELNLSALHLSPVKTDLSNRGDPHPDQRLARDPQNTLGQVLSSNWSWTTFPFWKRHCATREAGLEPALSIYLGNTIGWW